MMEENMTIKNTPTHILKFVKLSENARSPLKSTIDAAGYDISSAYEYDIPPRKNVLVKIDLQIQVPTGCYGRIAARSGLALKKSILIGGGVLDIDYRGNVGVIMFNAGDSPVRVSKWDRVAQLICEKIAYPALQECDSLDSTARGDHGFGSRDFQTSFIKK